MSKIESIANEHIERLEHLREFIHSRTDIISNDTNRWLGYNFRQLPSFNYFLKNVINDRGGAYDYLAQRYRTVVYDFNKEFLGTTRHSYWMGTPFNFDCPGIIRNGSITVFNEKKRHRLMAGCLYIAMKGVGTDFLKIKSVFEVLKNKEDLDRLFISFGEPDDWGLMQWMTSDLTRSQLDLINKMLKQKRILTINLFEL